MNIGDKINRLKIIDNAPDYVSPQGQHQKQFLCECDCGNKKIINASLLKREKIKSCGCLNSELSSSRHLKHKIGDIVDFLEIIDKVGTHPTNNCAIWKCRCVCGNIVEKTSIQLRKTDSKIISCGCVSYSKGENIIKNYLNKNNYIFKSNITLKTSGLPLDDNVNQMKFDFYVYKNNKIYLIEYDGLQHFKPFEKFGGYKKYSENASNDDLKNDYCKNNKIPLLRIKYSQNNIEEILDYFFSHIDYFYSNYNPFISNEEYYNERWTYNKTKKNEIKYVYDHKGNPFISIENMCKNYNITSAMYTGRLKRGWTQEDALTKPKNFKMFDNNNIRCTDHLGNEFQSITEMAKYYNMSHYALRNRLNNGYTIEEALTKPVIHGNNQYS